MARQASGSAKEVPGQEELMAFINELEQRLEAIKTAYRTQQWSLFLGKAAPELNSLDNEQANVLLDPEVWITVMRWVGTLSPANPAQRRMVLLGRELLIADANSRPDVYELNNELTSDLVQGPPSVGPQSASWGDWLSILHTDPDRHTRHQAWQALVPVASQLRERFLELVRRRNAWARKQGYDNYIDLALAPQGLSRDSVLERYVDLEEATALLADIRETLEFHSGSIDGYNLACKTIRIDQPVATCTATSRRCLAAAKKYLTNLQPEN